MNAGKVLVVDDDIQLRQMLEDFLLENNYEVVAFESAVVALDYLNNNPDKAESFDLIISDIRMPTIDGFEFTEKIRAMGLRTPLILMTAFASIPSAIEAIRKGAYDFITKPFKLSEILITIDRAVRYNRLQAQNRAMADDIKKSWNIGSLIGKSPQMRQVSELLSRVTDTQNPILITGEAGTGKEAIAKAIHNGGPRANEPFTSIDSTTLSDSIIEVELFGIDSPSRVKRGMLESISRGTIFINDIGDLDSNLQAKILHLIESKSFSPMGSSQIKPFQGRLIAATRKDLKKAIKEGNFREDLYFKLAVVPINLPPLRHRREDVPILVDYFIKKYCATNRIPDKKLNPKALDLLLRMKWEGNITELENTVERMVILSRGPIINENDIPMPDNESFESFYGSSIQDFPSLEQLEKRYMQLILEKVGGRKEKAAKILGINRRTLYRKEREYGFVHEDSPEPTDDE
jgi:DNA-binding NtrC family response regulator